MAMTQFREAIDWLDRQGLLARVSRPVDPRHELVAVLRKTQRGPNVALLFTAVRGTDIPVASNVLARRETLAQALGLQKGGLLAEMVRREGRTLPCEQVSDAPVQEIRIGAGDCDLTRDLPQIVHSEKDAGAYITAGVFLARDPSTGVYNASWNRAQLAAADRMRVRMMAPQHLGQYQAAAEARNQALPAAVVIGAPPALMLAAASKIPFEADELAVAGAWQGQPLRVTSALTVPLVVPADAEIVIEGEVLPAVREDEGPFGEFMDAYVGVGRNHVFRAKAITRRRDAIHHTILAGGTEDLSLLSLMLQMEVWKRVAPLVPLRDVGTPGQILGCVISIEKSRDDQARTALLAALAAHPWMKVVIAVDADVDPHDADEVLWAIHTRCTPDTALMHIPGVPSFPREDVAGLHRGKIAIDATYPAGRAVQFARRRFPGIEDLDLADYLGTRFSAS
jgi:UbiD family decarboxylase